MLDRLCSAKKSLNVLDKLDLEAIAGGQSMKKPGAAVHETC